jgi:hypothetical protein
MQTGTPTTSLCYPGGREERTVKRTYQAGAEICGLGGLACSQPSEHGWGSLLKAVVSSLRSLHENPPQQLLAALRETAAGTGHNACRGKVARYEVVQSRLN